MTGMFESSLLLYWLVLVGTVLREGPYTYGSYISGQFKRVAAHPRKPLVSETRGLRGWAATLPRAPALGFFGRLAVGFCGAGTGLFAVCGLRFWVCGLGL